MQVSSMARVGQSMRRKKRSPYGESSKLGLAEPSADDVEVIGTIGLLPDVEADIARGLARLAAIHSTALTAS